MLKSLLVVSAVIIAGAGAPVPQAPQTGSAAPAAAAKIPIADVNQVNPQKASSESLARAKKIYGYECSMCHGDDGGGTGDVGKTLKTKMPDFRDSAALKGRTDGELFYIIKNGEGEMDGEGPRLKPEDDWNLVNYVRSFGKGQTTAARTGPS